MITCEVTNSSNENMTLGDDDTGVEAQSTLGGKTFLPEKCMKNFKMPEFYLILARKIIKIS